MTLSTPPLATAVALKPGVGVPPVIVTVGAVKPNPDSSTEMLSMTPSEITAVAVATAVWVLPGAVTVTAGTDV